MKGVWLCFFVLPSYFFLLTFLVPGQGERLLEIAFPAGEPRPVGIDIILGAAVDAGVNGLGASPACLASVRSLFRAAPAVPVRFRFHFRAAILPTPIR